MQRGTGTLPGFEGNTRGAAPRSARFVAKVLKIPYLLDFEGKVDYIENISP